MSEKTKKEAATPAKKGTPKRTVRDPYISFNKAETEVLRTVCLRSLRLYFELKWLSNFKTGEVPKYDDSKLTYEYLAQRVLIPTSQGRVNSVIDGKEVARLIQRLEDAKLVAEVIQGKDGLTMLLPLSPIRSKAEPSEPVTPAPTETATPLTGSAEIPGTMPSTMDSNPSTAGSALTNNDKIEDEEDDWFGDDHVCAAGGNLSVLTGNLVPKLPTHATSQSVANTDGIREKQDLSDGLSVLVNTDSQYLFSVPVAPEHGSSARRPDGTAFIEGLTAEPTPNLNAGQIQDRLSRMYPQFHYLHTPVSAKFFERVAGLGVHAVELDEVASAMVSDPLANLTAGELFTRIVNSRKGRRGRLGSRVAL